MRWRITLLAAILTLGSSGCGPRRRKFVLPDVPQVAAKPFPEATIESPPEIDTPIPEVGIEWPKMSSVENPPAAKPAQERRTQPARPPVTPTTPVEAESPTQVPTEPAPRLHEVLTDSRRREYEADFTGFMAGARAALNRATGRSLTDPQKDTVANIKVFLQQAQESRAKDLALALQLARRAYVLGQDLLKSLR